jgi:hypothetical protein
MTEIIKDQILKIRDSGITNMFDVKTVFELAVKNNFHELANFIFEQTNDYTKFILTEKES